MQVSNPLKNPQKYHHLSDTIVQHGILWHTINAHYDDARYKSHGTIQNA